MPQPTARGIRPSNRPTDGSSPISTTPPGRPAKAASAPRGRLGTIVNTVWKTADFWLRDEITNPAGNYSNLQLNVHHDEDVEIYLDGKLAATVSGFTGEYEPIATRAETPLTPGKHLFTIHCHQTEGGQYIDLGSVDVKPAK